MFPGVAVPMAEVAVGLLFHALPLSNSDRESFEQEEERRQEGREGFRLWEVLAALP